MKKAIVNGKIVLDDSIREACLILDDDKIACAADCVPEDAEIIYDAAGNYVSPGFIDIHTHGGGGFDFMDGTVDAIIGACKMHLHHGTTSIVPTTLTCPTEELIAFFEAYRVAKETMENGPHLLGVHLEGPFFSQNQAGAQDPRYLKNPVPEEYLPILKAGGSDIVRISAAVELEGAMAFGDELSRRGILAAIGHSDADYSCVKEAVKHGYSHVTHLYSGMSALHRVGPYRVLGVVESTYLLDELSAEIIADGKHLPAELLKLIVKSKTIDKLCLITDSMRGAGLPEGARPLLGSLKNGQDTIIQDGVAMLPNLKAFAGSVCTADRCVRTMYKDVGLSLPVAVSMITRNPAKLLGISDQKGRLLPGMDADICIFDENINILTVFVDGSEVRL